MDADVDVDGVVDLDACKDLDGVVNVSFDGFKDLGVVMVVDFDFDFDFDLGMTGNLDALVGVDVEVTADGEVRVHDCNEDLVFDFL